MLRFVMFVILTGCALDEPSTSSVAQDLIRDGCSREDCNSPMIDTIGFHDLSKLPTVANSAGVRVLGMFDNANAPLAWDVSNGKLTANNPRTGAKYSGAGLVATHFLLSTGLGQYIISIADVKNAQTWAIDTTGKSATIETYLLDYTKVGGYATFGLCDAQQVYVDKRTRALDKDIEYGYSVLFEGERIHSDTHTIDTTIDTTWFNIGCNYSSLVKLVLTGHVGALTTFSTSVPERQTMLRVFGANYCSLASANVGKSFTVAGTHLLWQDAHGYNAFAHAPTSLEARWNTDGVMCLATPRGVADYTVDMQTAFPLPGVETAITNSCVRPSLCADLSTNPDGAYVVTANW